MAVYAHLQPGGALVQPGQRVRRGRPIGLSGNSGASGGPHLHFAVQVNRGMHLESIPFRMFGDRGILRFSEPAVESHRDHRSEEHTSELQSLMRISYAVFCLKKKKRSQKTRSKNIQDIKKT